MTEESSNNRKKKLKGKQILSNNALFSAQFAFARAVNFSKTLLRIALNRGLITSNFILCNIELKYAFSLA